MSEDLVKGAARETGSGTDLWRVILAPVVWVVHFLLVYLSAAIYCEKIGRKAALAPLQTMVLTATVVALLAIGVITRGLWRVRARSLTEDDFDFEHNSPEERHRFLSHVALMLAAVSSIAVLFPAVPALYLTSCQ